MAEDPGSIVRVDYNTIELPPSVEIRESSVSSGQAGAFAKTVIPKDTKFGPYKGDIINAGQKDYIDYRYAWEVFEQDSNILRHTVSALDSKSSNWMRHVNCARFYEEQNILSIQEEYSIFYVAMKNIKPGEELLTWFDPKLLKRTKRRLSKMGRKPVGYTIELVPWSDEKKFVPEIIETKRKIKKKVLSDMISLDENPLVITRTLQSLSKIPCTPKQIAQSSFRGAPMNVGVKTSRTVLPALAPKRENMPPTQHMITGPQNTANKVNEYITVRSNTERGKQNGSDKFRCTSLEGGPKTEVMQKEAKKVVCSDGDAVKITDKKVNKNMLLKKNAMKLGRARLQCSAHRQLLHIDNSSVKPIVVKQNEDGSTSVEDHDETYVLNNMELRPECDDECPCLASNKSVKSHSSVKDKPDTFVIHFTLLPEHKSLSADNKIIYRCDVCDGAYNHAFSLKRHYLSVHVNHRYLSRDDILSCQIETFHMDVDLQNEHAEIKICTLKDGESSASKVQSADQTSVSSSGQAEMSVHGPDNLGQSLVKECENNDKENISIDAQKVTVAQQFTSVPSLKQLVQILLGKGRGTTMSCSPVSLQKLSMACGEVKTGSCVVDSHIRSEGTEPESLGLPHHLDSGMDCVISSLEGTEPESLGLSHHLDSGMDCVISSLEGTEPESLGLPHHLDSGMDCVISSLEGTEPESLGLPHQLDSGMDCVISSLEGTEPESLGLPHQLDSGMDCVISKQNEEISKAGDVSLDVHIDMEKKPEGSTLEILSAHEDILCEADEISTNSSCAQIPDNISDLNPNRLGHRNKNVKINSSLNRDVAPGVADSIGILENSQWEIASETSELNSDLPIKTITGDLQEYSNGEVCGKNGEKSRDLCHSHWNQVLANHSEASAESVAVLNEGSPTINMSDCSAEKPDIMQPVDTISTGSVLDLFNISGTDCPGKMVPYGDSSSHVADTLTCFGHSSPTASSPPFILSQVFPAGIYGVSPVVDIEGLKDVSPVVDIEGLKDVSSVGEPAGLIDVSPVVDTVELKNVTQVVDTAGLIDVSPVQDTAGLIDVSPVEDTAGLIDVSPVVDTAGLIDVSSVVDTAGLIDVSPVANTAGLIDVSPVEVTAGLIDVSPVVDTTGLIDVSPVEDTAGLIDVSPVVDTAGLIDVSPIVDTAGLIDVSPVVDTAGLIDVSPVVDTAGLIDVSPVEDTAGLIDVTPVVDTAGLIDVTPVVDTSGLIDVSPVVDTAGLIDVSPVVDTAGLIDVSPVEDTARLIDVSPVVDTAGLIDVSPVVDTAGLIDVSPVVDTAGLIDVSPVVNTAGSIDVSPVEDTAGLIDVTPVVDTAGLIDVTPVVDTAGLIDVSPVVDTAGLIDVTPVVDTAGLIDVSPVEDIAGLIDVSPVVDTSGLIDVTPGVDTAGLIDVSPVVDTAGINEMAAPLGTNTTTESCDFVSPVVNNLVGYSSEAAASESVQNMDFLTDSVTTQGKPKSLDNHLPTNSTVEKMVENSTSPTTSASVIQSPSAQKLIFVTNLVFPVISPSHQQPHNSSSVSPGPSPLTTKTSQSASVPLVVISQVPCGLNMQNAASAFLPSSSALKALQTMKSSFGVLNFGNSSSGLSLSVLSPGTKSSNSPVGDKVLLDSAFPHRMSAAATTATSPKICSPSEHTAEKLMKPRLNLCAQFAAITPMVFGGPHVPASSAGGSSKCTASSTTVPLSSISSSTSAGNATFVEGQPDDLYRCHMCVRVFRTMNELKLHIRNDPHRFKGGIKQYACQQCSMRFSNKNNLIRHNLMNHLESENYKFRCYTCGKGFMCETYLKMHARFHSGRNFPCKYGCTDMYFPNAASLVKHLRTQHPGLNLKEYLRNAKACKAHSKKLNCLLQKSLKQNTSPGTEGHTLETSQRVASKLCYSLEQPGLGFQAKRGHSKSSKTAAVLPHGEERNMADEGCGLVVDNEESPPNTEDISRLRYVCHVCLKRFCSHLKLLQHRTQHHGANESVQEYLYEMSKDTLDEDLSDTVSVKLKFSPPPSPTSFFENVNKRGFENMNHYIDGNKESLQFWQKHLNLADNSEPLLVSEAAKKLEWTTFNFPPCFEYREDCTVFYDSATQPGTSPRLLPYPAEDPKVAVLKQETIEPCPQMVAESILHCGGGTCSQNVNSCMEVDEQGLVGTCDSQDHVKESHHGGELNKSIGSVTKTDSCEPVHYSEKITLEQNKQCAFVNLAAEKQEMNERDALSEESVVEGVLSEDTVSVTKDDSGTNQEVETETENHYICRYIVSELVNSAESTIEEKYIRGRSDSMLDGNSNLKACPCEGVQSASDAPSNIAVPPDVEVKVEIKQETSEPVQEIKSTSYEPFIVTDMISHKFPEFSIKDKLDWFQSQCIQGLDLAVSEHHHALLLQKGLLLRGRSVSHLKSQNSRSLLGALDLQIMNGQWSSETLGHKSGDGCPLASTCMNNRALSLESLVLWPQGKQSVRHFGHVLDTSLNNSDTSRHDHRRYSIWTGQVHQRFDSTSKHDMFCQPVTEAVRKQEVMRETAQYNYEKSVRDNEMQGKDEKATQKASFAESLGLMSRNEFELSYHARRQQHFIIKVPEVWNNYENIWFGKKGNITVVCSVCHRHFSCWDLCLRHQLKKHPHIEPASLEMEKDNYVEDMFYYYPMPYGILAQTHLIPDNLPVPEVYVCLRCGFPFKNINRLHAHMIICDPAQEDASSSQNSGVRKVSYMKKKLLPMMDRRLHQQVEQPKTTKVSKTKSGVDMSAASVETRHNKSLPVNGKTSKPAQHTLDNKLMTSAVHSRTDYSTHFSFYSPKKGKNYELLYNPQNHTRRREMYTILDQHQCHGCNLKFNSLYMLERHVNKCSGKDKLQNQKPLLSGIMPDDAALRKQHTCRYCGKRFTYIKGVDLHYKRICAVRKVKEEENQLTEEDLAHEAELKKILEHIKWSKSLSKDSSDIIQGHVRVEEDGTLTRVVKDSDCSPGQKKKLKKKGCNWTTLKRHRTEEDVDSASSVSSDIHRSPGNTKSVADEKVADNLDAVGKKRLTRSAGQDGFHQKNGISSTRPTSAERGAAGKKAETSSKSSLVNSTCKSHSPSSRNKTGGNCRSLKGTSKKLACNELIDVSESRKNKTGKGSVRTSRSSLGTRNRQVGSIVSPAESVTVCIKPPDRKRGKPKRFDPSDMESSYKKKKKDEDIILEQTKPESGGRKRNTANETKQKVSTAAKGSDAGKSSHVLRQTSSRSSTDVSTSAPTSKVCVNKNQSNKEDESKLFEKMKKLKEAAKSESRKSSQKRKLSVSLFTNYANKKCDSGGTDEKKSDKPVNKVSNSSELFKHLTTSEQSLQKHSPQKTASNRKRISSMDDDDDDDDNVSSSQMSAKRLKITTPNGRSKSPAKAGFSTTSHDMESPGSHFSKVAQKYHNKSQDKYKESDQEPPIVRTSSSSAPARTLSSSATSLSPDSKRSLSKPTSPISKQPTVTFKVVTLSPNGSNLLTYDSSADVPQSSLLLTKASKGASHTSPAQQILKCLPQRPIQVVTKTSSLLQGTELQKLCHEPNIKVISAENLGLNVVHKQALSTLVIAEGDNIRIQKPISQVCNQGFVSQKDVQCRASSSPDGKQGLTCRAVYKQDNNQISQSLHDTETQISHHESSQSQGRVIIQRVVDKHFRDNQLIGNNFEGQVMLSSSESSLTDSTDEIFPKQFQKTSENDSSQLFPANLFTKQTGDAGTADENPSAGQNQAVVSSTSSVLTLTEPQPQCQKQQTFTEQSKSEVCQSITSVNQSHPRSSNIVSVKSFSALHVANFSSPSNNHESVSTIVVPSTTVKVHVTLPHTVSTTTATKLTFPNRFKSPAKVVTVTGTVLPHLSPGNPGHTATRILKLGGVSIKSVPVSTAQPQTQNLTVLNKQVSNTPCVVPQNITQKPLVLTAGQLPRLLTAGARQQRPNTQQIIMPGALRQSMLNIAANQTNCATQILPGRRLPKTVSPQICIPQSSLVNKIVNVAKPLGVPSVGSSLPASSIKSKKTSSICLIPAPVSAAPTSNQIMFSLDDGTTAMLDPDSLAQFLTVSPSLSKSELYSTVPPPTAVQEYKNPLVLSHPNVEEINWPANGTVDLTDLPDTIID